MWNELIKIRDNIKNEDIVNLACILLSQMNTAGVIDMIKEEVKRFILQNKIKEK